MVGYISNNNLFPEPLTAEEEKIYLEKLANGDENAINVDYSNVKKWLNGQAIMSKTSYNKIKNIYKI